MEEKLREIFEDIVVYKDLSKGGFFKSLGLPSFLRDWLLNMFCDEEGKYNAEEVSDFVKTHMPKKEDWIGVKDKIITENQRVKILTKIAINIDIKTGEVSFALPNYGLTDKETIIEQHVWNEYKSELVNGTETWGIIELGYRFPDEFAKPKIPGKIKMTSFTNFCPYSIDLEFYKDVRSEFTVSEWIDVLLGAIDYNAAGYKDESEKMTMLSRLLPFVEQNLNLLELAPKGTGKSYVFGNISKYGMIADGGKITRAKMFYDTGRRTPGFIVGHDFVAIDEVKLVTFNDVNEMRSVMQSYMANRKFTSGGVEVESNAGIIFLGNIDQDNMDEYKNMFTELPSLFKESALVDRVHGFIKGWDIPEMNENLIIKGWALNTEYFCTIMHQLRDDSSYRAIVEELLQFSEGAYIRHVEAIENIATAYLKLLFPNVRSVNDINPRLFVQYCLRPAIRMRSVIHRQLSILDKEYKKESKQMPDVSIKENIIK